MRLRGWIVLAAALVVAALGALLWGMMPTHGPRVGTYASPRTALLVIDMQEDYTGPRAPRPYAEAPQLVERVNRVIAAATRRRWLVVFVRNEVPAWDLGSRLATGNTGVRGTPGAAVDARLARPRGSIEITKGRADAFSNRKLDEVLAANGVASLVVVGVDAAACLGATVRGALNRGYDVSLPADCTATRFGKPLDRVLDRLKKTGARLTTSAAVIGRR